MKNMHWIQGDGSCESPLFRRTFTLSEKPQKACLEICGLGYFQAFVNGKRIGNEEFTPAVTGYSSVLGCKVTYPVWEERSGFRTGYLVYDIAEYLQPGENVLGVWLGNGWYHQTKRQAEGKFVFGFPKLRYELTITGEGMEELYLESDRQTMWSPSEILENNLFYGEKHDLRLRRPDWCMPGADMEGWKKAVPVHAPETELTEQTCPPDRIIRSIQPKLIQSCGGRKLYDCEENITGWVTLNCVGESGSCVKIRHSEELSEDGCSLDFESAGGKNQIQEDCYICAEEPQTVHPRFCWHGFRYFEVEGAAEPVDVSVIHTDLSVTSDFCCSDPVLNWIYDAYIRTQLGNVHGCVPSDCPHRERLGYTGDGQITAETVMMTLDSGELYKKWMQDIWDSQGKETGHIPHTAPFLGGGGGPGGWGGAVFVVPALYYQVYGDSSLLEKGYEPMMRWLDYMEDHSEDGLIVREEEGGWCLGEWCTPRGEHYQLIPEEFVNTCYYIRGLRTAQETEKLLQKPISEHLAYRLEKAKSALKRHFFDEKTESFCNGENGADAFALDLGMGTAQTVENLIQRYEKLGALDTGILGTPLLIEQLFKHGAENLAFRLLAGNYEYSFAYMMEHHATTLWETWEGGDSHNHPMFGGVVRLFFTEILGIRQTKGSVGFQSYEIKPRDIKGLEWAEGWITAPAGRIKVRWERDEEGNMQIMKGSSQS